MRQVDGSDLLGQNDPRNAEIGILHVGAEDSRQEILTAINAQELLGRKQIAIVLPEQGKAFRQPVEFDGLKNMRRGLKAQLIFIASPGPGPAEFARHRRFVVYSSLETFKTALLSERGLNPRAKTASGDEKKPGLLGRGRANKEREQNPSSTQRIAAIAPVTPVMLPTPPTPHIAPGASAQPVMPPTPPTPRMVPAFDNVEGPIGPQRTAQPVPSPISPLPIDEMETHTLEFESPVAGMGARTAHAVDDDDDLALPPVTPRQPQGGGNAPDVPGAGGSPAAGPRTPESRRSPTPLLLGQPTNTPRPAGSGKLPATASQGSQTRIGTGKSPATAGRGTRQLPGSQKQPDASASPRQPNGKNGGTGKIPVVAPAPISPDGPAVLSGSGSSAAATTVAATAGAPGGPGIVQRQSGLTPLPPPVSQRRRRSRGRWRLVLLAVLLILLTLLVGGLIANGMGGLGGLASLGHPTATVTITPRSQIVQNSYLLSGITTGTPDPARRQVGARLLTAQSDTKQGTGNATGSIPATAAQGVLTFQNVGGTGLTIGTTVLTGADGVQVKFFGPVFVPATGSASATATGYAVNTGAAGNIAALDIKGNCCTANIFVKNLTAFTGGQDPQPNSVIQKSDIDGAAKPLISELQTSTKAKLDQQARSNERIVDGSFNCQQTTTADHNVGDRVKSVTVTVSVKCTEEVFDFVAAQQIASNLLPGGTNLTGYKLAGLVLTTLVNSSVVSAQGDVSMTIQAAGKWVYQFTNQLQQQIKSTLVGRSKDQALGILKQYAGLALADISISSGSTMPASASDISINLVPVPGLQQGTPTGTQGTPGGSGGTQTGGNTPTGSTTPTPRPTGSPQIGS